MNSNSDISGLNLQLKVNQLLNQQINEWDLAQKNYKGLEKAHKKFHTLDNRITIGVQFNSERIYSSSAKVDAKSISERKCFLCLANLPEQQRWVEFGEYVILVNPFPIFPRHLTIPHRDHSDQQIKGHFGDMLRLASQLKDFVVFYNGPRCGASAPDHFHFQAGNKGFMPIEQEYSELSKSIIKGQDGCRASVFTNYLRQCIILEGNNEDVLGSWFNHLYVLMETAGEEKQEPMMNILASREGEKWRIFIFPRKLHRPWQFFEQGEKQILLSPASVDLGGVLITPREEDYHKLTADDIRDIFAQVSWEDDKFEKMIKAFAKL